MKKLFTFIFLIYLPILLSGQIAEETSYNLGFETFNKSSFIPTKWMVQPNTDYKITIDSIVKYRGKYSLRIESQSKQTKESYAFVAIILPADFRCDQVEVKAEMKFEDVKNGNANFGLTLYNTKNKNINFSKDLSELNLSGSCDWKEYTVNVQYNPGVQYCYISIPFSGTGKVWFDDFQILIDGENYFTTKKRIGYYAKLDNEFDKGSQITNVKPDKSSVSNLTQLAKVWGFLKYYHPSVADGNYNWDYELFRIMPNVINSKDPVERNQVLSKWLDKLGEPKSFQSSQTFDSTKVKLFPDLKWIQDKNALGIELVRKLDNIKRAQRSGSNYFVELGYADNPVFKNENSYTSMNYPDVGYRLLSLFRIWNIIQYYSPYKYLIDEDWNKVLPEFIPKFIYAKNETEYRLVVLELLTHIQDTHATIPADDEIVNNYKGKNFIPIEVSFVEDKLIVTNFLNKETEEKTDLKRGDIILSINGQIVKSVVKKSQSITPASNYPTQLRNIARDILRTNEKQLEIKYESDGIVKTKIIDAIPWDIFTYYNAFIVPKGDYSRLVSNDIGYINLGCKRTEELPKILSGLKNTKGLIIDLRNMPEVSILDKYGEFLMPERKIFVKFTNADILTPGLFSFGLTDSIGKANTDCYKGRLVILVNENSQSRAEYYAMAFRAVPNSIIIGSTTAGADGNISPFSLPGGITTMISGLGVYYPNGKETQRVGIIPDLVIKPSIKSIKENKDELIDAAIKIINNSK
jgi:C-terminal processing protease CtpA/Prc